MHHFLLSSKYTTQLLIRSSVMFNQSFTASACIRPGATFKAALPLTIWAIAEKRPEPAAEYHSSDRCAPLLVSRPQRNCPKEVDLLLWNNTRFGFHSENVVRYHSRKSDILFKDCLNSSILARETLCASTRCVFIAVSWLIARVASLHRKYLPIRKMTNIRQRTSC